MYVANLHIANQTGCNEIVKPGLETTCITKLGNPLPEETTVLIQHTPTQINLKEPAFNASPHNPDI